jgi:hypothetical protein
MHRLLAALFLGLTAIAVGTRADEPLPPDLPKEVKDARAKLDDWVNSFVHKTSQEILKELGAPTDRTAWEFMGNKELLLHYKTAAPKSILALYFYKDRVVTSSLQLLSDSSR